uniref:Uncharacterized protein n=1 Tax=viral metagenome TaxID=1070528 RepID=A0A6C0H530_9ZZZZ
MEQLVKEILKYYLDKEQKLVENNYKYFHLIEETLETDFEIKSNAKLLLVKSKLPKEDMAIVLSIFDNIYSNNYFIFQDLEFLKQCYLNNDDDDEEEDDDENDEENDDENDEEEEEDDEEEDEDIEDDFLLMKTFDLKYLELWLYYLNYLGVYDIKSYKKIPKPLLAGKGQKIFEIKDIIDMI